MQELHFSRSGHRRDRIQQLALSGCVFVQTRRGLPSLCRENFRYRSSGYNQSVRGTMAHKLEHTIELLARMPSALDALLRGLPEEWTARNEGENTWSVLEVVGHLINGERTAWMARARIILKFGDTREFEPFDRLGQRRLMQGKSLPELLDEFADVRAKNLDELRDLKLGPEKLELRGQHPAFGTVTLSKLLATWAVHDLTHLHQISRILAHQYREAVGPWSRYLGVLQCAGHSASA
jgi:hypothetical protein